MGRQDGTKRLDHSTQQVLCGNLHGTQQDDEDNQRRPLHKRILPYLVRRSRSGNYGHISR